MLPLSHHVGVGGVSDQDFPEASPFPGPRLPVCWAHTACFPPPPPPALPLSGLLCFGFVRVCLPITLRNDRKERQKVLVSVNKHNVAFSLNVHWETSRFSMSSLWKTQITEGNNSMSLLALIGIQFDLSLSFFGWVLSLEKICLRMKNPKRIW